MIFSIFGQRPKTENKLKNFPSRLYPAILAVVIFICASIICFLPQTEGKVLPQHDIQQFDGMSRDIRDCRQQTGEDPQWTGAMFGGMPAYLINIKYPTQIIKNSTEKILNFFSGPIWLLVMAMLAAFGMALMMGLSAWTGIIVGLSYGLSTYFMLIIGAGHITKMWALIYAPLLMGAIYMTLRRNTLWGGALSALFATLEIGAGHPQITYYFLLAALFLWINDAVFAIREKRLRSFSHKTAILALAAILAIGANFSSLWYTAQHTKETIRGGSEISLENGTSTGGLDLRYATAWSYGIAESWNMFIPDFMGGDSAASFSKDGAVALSLDEIGLKEMASQLPAYWGEQPYTAGPTYLGAVVLLLAVLGLILSEKRNRYWIAAISILALLLAWGHNMMWFTELCFKYLPGYNKFRTVSMALVLVEWSVPMLAGLGITELVKRIKQGDVCKKALMTATLFTSGIALLFFVLGSAMFDFGQETDSEMMSGQFYQMFKQANAQEYIQKGLHDELGWETAKAMAEERAEIMSADALRSLVFVLLAACTVALYCFSRIRAWLMSAILIVLVAADLISVNLRYMPYSKFVPASYAKVRPSEANKEIMEAQGPADRVLNLSVSPFNDATTSLFHRSIGGYHGAKLGRYQDIIDRYLQKGKEKIYDMLNTRFIITNQGTTLERDTNLGAAWFVKQIQPAASPMEELESLAETDLSTTAVVAQSDLPHVLSNQAQGTIKLCEYQPNHLVYEYTADADAVAVFSEIYYDKGWTAYIDGVQAEYFRADYILRAMELPRGTHTVVWKFRAPGWTVIEAITLICSLLVIFAVLILAISKFRHVSEKQ